jgi:hypothetical protein
MRVLSLIWILLLLSLSSIRPLTKKKKKKHQTDVEYMRLFYRTEDNIFDIFDI